MALSGDEEELLAFVADIDARKPLGGAQKQSAGLSGSLPLVSDVAAAEPTTPALQPMLTTASAIDERLKAINDTFLASLESIDNPSDKRISRSRSGEGM